MMFRNAFTLIAIGLALVRPANLLARDAKKPADWITPDTQKAIDGGLEYLAKQQAKDGSWGTGTLVQGSPGITALAAEAFLSTGHRPGAGPFGEHLTKAIDYILKIGAGSI